MTDKEPKPPRLVAFYLTQFHPIPENDKWWGKGFTEWTNVTKASPLFPGHYQPHLPTDLGFYDLRLRATRREQIRIAKDYGIDGFCYHYYWFSGTRLLNEPLDDMLADPGSDMPFCLCWANENWTRRWNAAEHDVLIAQRYLPSDDLNFIDSLLDFFRDRRYIRIDGKPFLIVYRPQHLPDARKTAAIWRQRCVDEGIGEIHLCAALTHGNEDYEQFGFDSGVEFPPHNAGCTNVAHQFSFHSPFRGSAVEFTEIAGTFLERRHKQENVFRCVFPSWDNTARTGDRATFVLNACPENYEYWLVESIRRTRDDFPNQDRFVFINAWNEWAEGCHLEPDRKHGRQYLEATLAAKKGLSKVSGFLTFQPNPRDRTPQRTLFSDLRQVGFYHGYRLAGRLAGQLKRHPRLRRFVRHFLSRWA